MTTTLTKAKVSGDTPAKTILGYEVHPSADVFPLLEGEDLKTLAASIKAHGLKESIKLFDGKILDGRNRGRALELLGAKNIVAEKAVLGDLTPSEYVWIHNIERRHLTAPQRRNLAGTLTISIRNEQKSKAKAKRVNAAAAAAKIAGTSKRTASREAAKLDGKAPPTPKLRIVQGELEPVEPKVGVTLKAERNLVQKLGSIDGSVAGQGYLEEVTRLVTSTPYDVLLGTLEAHVHALVQRAPQSKEEKRLALTTLNRVQIALDEYGAKHLSTRGAT